MSPTAPTRRRRRPRRAPLASSAGRLRLLVLLVAILFSVTATRAVQIQVVQAEEMANEAAEKMTVGRDLPAQRGRITGRDGQVLAFTESTVNVVADPKAISTNGREPEAMTGADHEKAAAAPYEMAQVIARHLEVDPLVVQEQLGRRDSRYQILGRQVPTSAYVDLAAELNEGGWVGIYRESNPRRVYPMGSVGSNVVGYLVEGKGAGGVELALQRELAGVKGKETFETSPYGRIPLGTQVLTPAQDGCDVQLTIDPDLQWMVERRLADQVDKVGGNWGVAIVMDVETGQLLSMANYPSFDSNDTTTGQTQDLQNRAVGAAYEPGSVQKVLTLASLLDAGVTTPDTTYRIGSELMIDTHRVTDAFSHDDMDITTRGILVNSSNIGAITAARTMDKTRLRDYLADFGLGVKPGLGLPGEASGSLPSAKLYDWQRDSLAYGYGLSVTSVQMAAAVAAIGNGGVYTAPSIVSSTTCNGTTTPAEAPEQHRVISAAAAQQTTEMMEQKTIKDRRLTWIDGYRSGTKTGTARIASAQGGYRGQVASMIGIAPIEDPQVLVYVLIARPDTAGGGLGMAGPVYRDVMSLALPRYGVVPSAQMVETQLPLQK